MPVENEQLTKKVPPKAVNSKKDKKGPKKEKKGSKGKLQRSSNVDVPDNNNDDVNNLTTDELFRLADLHFNKKNYMFRHLYNSYNKFLEEDVKNFLENGDHKFTEIITNSTYYGHGFKYENVVIDEPTLNNGAEPMFPSDARHNNYTYSVKLIADVTQYQEIIDIASDQKIIKKNGNTEKGVHIGTIPLMVRSKWCSLNTNKGVDKNECDYDPGGYFIVNGNEKVVIAQDRMVENKPLVFIKKDSGSMSYIVQTNSRSYKPHGMTQVLSVKMKKDGILILRVPILNEVNVCAVFRAFGLQSDRSIIDFIAYDEYDTDMVDLIRVSLDACKNEKGMKISTQEEAIDYLIPKLRVSKKYTESDRETKLIQKQLHLKNLLQNNFLPHVEGPPIKKAYYLGYMLNRLLRVFLKRLPLDDRDSYVNKRIDLPGDLMFDLFRQQYKKLMNECKKFFESRNKGNTNPINVISNIKPNIIEQGFKASLSTGHWIRRQGVAQMLQRLTYLQTLSFLRRVDAPGGDASSAKLTSPRHLHPSSVGHLCVTGDTEILQSDGATVKLIKDMRDGDHIQSVYKDTLDEAPTPIKEFFSKMSDDILEITTISGRKLKCTGDHPIFIRTSDGKFEMRNANKLKNGDQVVVRHFQKYLPLNEKSDVVINTKDIDETYYVPEFILANVLDKPISQEKLEITARLIGANVSDGHLSVKVAKDKTKTYNAEFILGEESDAFEIMEDIKRMGFGASCYLSKSQCITRHVNKDNGIHTTHKTWCVSKGGAFAYYLKLMGAFVGDKTMQKRSVPDWIMNGNDRIKREFLSGFVGGDGCRATMQKNEEHFKVCLRPIGQTTLKEFKKDTIKYMTSISELFENFGIVGKTSTESVNDDSGNIDETKVKVLYSTSNSYENVGKFLNVISYRYCGEKTRASAPVVEYVKFKNTIADDKQQKYDTILNLHKDGLSQSKIIKTTGIDAAMVKRIVDNYKYKDGHVPKPRECNDSKVKYNDFVKQYYIENNKLAIPIKSIVKAKPEMVYDFTTSIDTHTILGNGIVFSNCSIQTPEHTKVGLTKHFTLICSVTIMTRDQYSLMKDFLAKRVTDVTDLPHHKLRSYNVYKVFLNGDWLGVTDKAAELEKEMIKNKLEGFFDQQNVSIVADHEEGEIRVYCESGRLYRPVLRVDENNRVLLTKSHIQSISLNKVNQMSKVTDWDEFLNKYPGVIEYIDMEVQPYVMLADKLKTVEIMRQKLIKAETLAKDVKSRHVDNRYDEMFYNKYSHCEIHPALLIGEILTNIPFSDRNAGARSIFQYSQGRQAMGVYATNYRDRLDISFILYYPQKPLVTTRTAKYTNSETLPSGENAMVAIACYTGYNQEDSLIVNRTSIERGKFRAAYYKKYLVSVQKNQSTSQDDIFMKPDANKVTNMKHGSYDKLNEKGYAPEETVLLTNDAIFGKVTPVGDANEASKPFRDSSELYKMYPPGVVDRTYIDIQNQDGYLTRKASVRSDRVPRIGDKYCCYDDKTEILTSNGWILFKDLTTDHKVASLINGKTLKYQKPIEVQEYDHDGRMYKVNSQQVDLVVTDNHRMYVKRHGSKVYRIEEAQFIENKIVKYQKNVSELDISHKSSYIRNGKFILPEYNDRDEIEIPLNEWIEFFGIWIAEGCLASSGTTVTIAANKQRVKDRLRVIVPVMGFKLCENMDHVDDEEKNTFNINNVQLASYFIPYNVGAVNKFLPKWVWTLTMEQCKLLLTAMLCGDGHRVSKKSSTRRYDTSSIDLANDVQRLCLHSGYSCNIKLKYEKGHVSQKIKSGKNKGKRITSTEDSHRMSVITVQNNPIVNKYKNNDKKQDSWIDYKGKVYCCTLPEDPHNTSDGIVYVRRNEVPVWCGQSRHGQKGTIGILLPGIDMPFNKYGVRPDIILNTNAIPSRMTIGQLVECLVGKVAALQGMDADGTSFEEHDIPSVKAKLKELGYEENGKEFLYNGMTGEKMKVAIYFGPTFYQRLKHLVEDKLHSRARGPKTSLTRQAPEGR